MRVLIALFLLSGVALAATTGNMRLVKPDVDVPDAEYVEKLNTIFDQIDAHDHSDLKGVPLRSGLAGISVAQIADFAVTSSKIAVSGVTTQNIADGAITISKLATVSVGTPGAPLGGFAYSLGSGSFSTTSTSFQQAIDGPTLSVTGMRPAFFGLVPEDAASVCNLTGVGSCEVQIAFTSATGVMAPDLSNSFVMRFGPDADHVTPCSAIKVIRIAPTQQAPSSIRSVLSIRSVAGANCILDNARMIGYEL